MELLGNLNVSRESQSFVTKALFFRPVISELLYTSTILADNPGLLIGETNEDSISYNYMFFFLLKGNLCITLSDNRSWKSNCRNERKRITIKACLVYIEFGVVSNYLPANSDYVLKLKYKITFNAQLYISQ